MARSLMAIVEDKVKPERMTNNRDELRRKYWWQFGETVACSVAAIAGLERVLVLANCGATPHLAFAFLPTRHGLRRIANRFPLRTFTPPSAPSSPASHEIWARFFGSTMKDDPVYTPSDCFETFPFPDKWETRLALEAAGKTYYEYRAALMVKNNEGLTETYNHFHDPDELDSDILKLRELHAVMDRAVLAAYGWSDIRTDCEFLLDYEIDEEEWGDKKKPWRYRWPDEIRDEVLARLLELNAERAKEEDRSGATAAKKTGKKAAAKRLAKTSETEDLFS